MIKNFISIYRILICTFESNNPKFLCFMKNLFWSLSLVFCSISFCNAQKVFVTEYENQAAVKVYAVDYENQADLLVYKVNYENQAGKNNGKWFFTKYENQAKKKLYFVRYENQADLKIYFVEYENQAGWRNKSKQYLLY